MMEDESTCLISGFVTIIALLGLFSSLFHDEVHAASLKAVDALPLE